MDVADLFEDDNLQQILEEIAQENGFEKPKYEVSAASKAGDNYMGRVLRAVVHEMGQKKKDSLSMIFKTPPVSQARRDACRSGIVYRNEGSMYTIVFPALNAFLNEHGLSDTDTFPNTARCLSLKLAADVAENGLDILVLEDMKAKGFSMVEKTSCLDAEKCRIVLRKLALIHGTSLALRYHRPEEAAQLESNIKEVIFEKTNPLVFELMPLFQKSTDCIQERYPKGSPEYSKLEKFLENYVEDFFYLTKPNEKLSCVTHGDCWSNNVLFKFGKDDKIEDICLIDFQISRVASPVLDIVYILFTCTTKKTRDAHYKSLLRGYYDDLSSTLSALSCDPEVVCPWSLFEDQVKAYGRYGLGMALMTLPLFLADSSDVPDIDEMMDKGDSVFDAFNSITTSKTDELIQRSSDVLLDTIELGYL